MKKIFVLFHNFFYMFIRYLAMVAENIVCTIQSTKELQLLSFWGHMNFFQKLCDLKFITLSPLVDAILQTIFSVIMTKYRINM